MKSHIISNINIRTVSNIKQIVLFHDFKYFPQFPEVDDSQSRINTYSEVRLMSFSLANEFNRMYEDKERRNGVKRYSKQKKREGYKTLKTDFITYKIRMILRWRE